jgi:hypothetical protein
MLNVTKSHGLLLGSWKHRSNLPVPLNWSSVSITVLGCRLGNDLSVDWDSLITKFEDQLRLWKHCQLSFCGLLIANILGLSTFWYQATIFDVPKPIVNRINKILFPFVWNKKKEWMARSSVTQPLTAGGLGVVDVSRPFVLFGFVAIFLAVSIVHGQVFLIIMFLWFFPIMMWPLCFREITFLHTGSSAFLPFMHHWFAHGWI